LPWKTAQYPLMAGGLVAIGWTILTKKKPHTVLIVDDHTLMRNGLEAMLQLEADYDVIGVAADGRAAIQAAADLKPEVILIDLTMPRTSGIDAIVQIKRRQPATKIIALTFHKEDKYIHATLEAGADGYVLKDDSRTELLNALANVLSGKSYLSPTIAAKVVAGYLSGGENKEKEPSWEVLTKREREVIKLIAEGKRTKDIAAYLSLSPKTVEKHRTNLMKKLDLHSVSAVTVYAIQNGFITE
jgi:two-component system response regulator NreC